MKPLIMNYVENKQFFTDYRIKTKKQEEPKIKWFSDPPKIDDGGMFFDSLGDCLNCLSEKYSSAKNKEALEFKWFIFDFEKRCCYSASFEIEKNNFFEFFPNLNLDLEKIKVGGAK